jgi:hypothetical protein
MEEEKSLNPPVERFIGAVNLVSKQTERLLMNEQITIAEIVRKIDSLNTLENVLSQGYENTEEIQKSLSEICQLRSRLKGRLFDLLGFSMLDEGRILPLFANLVKEKYNLVLV